MNIEINDKVYSFDYPITLQDIAKQYFKGREIYGAIVDHKLCELTMTIDRDAVVEWIEAYSSIGKQIYERTLTFIFIVATKQLFPQAKVKVEFAFEDGLYCQIEKDDFLTPQDVDMIYKQMKLLVSKDLPIIRSQMKRQEAIEYFDNQGMEDKAKLLYYRDKEMCSLYTLEGFNDYFYGFMLPSTSYVKEFCLQFYAPGLRLARNKSLLNSSHLFEVMKEYEKWGALIGVDNVAMLNELVSKGKLNDLMLISEAMIEKKLAELALNIKTHHEKAKIILISGPSSAGKTTFSKRLSIHLQILGIQPITISMDDFYLNRADTPLLENGEYDFESVQALDLQLFNETMLQLIHHHPVRLPRYNFVTGCREYDEHMTCLDSHQILIVEGIHGLNPQTSFYIPDEFKVKIYINALTHLNYDNHNRITTTDYRLLRRIVRDYQFRRISAMETIKRWQNVKNGEDKYIYPYQEEADYIFNTSMVYELPVLKPIAQKLLLDIPKESQEYIEANRLIKLLDYFVEGQADIPRVSLLAEFVGNSIFEDV